MQHRRTLSIVVPAYNEAESLPHLAEALHQVMVSLPYALEIILVDDADDSYDFSHLEAFVEKLRQGFDLVAGLTLSLFYLFARVNSHLSGIHPLPDSLKRLVTKWTIERGVYIGIPLILAGVAGALYALFFWSQSQFGNLDPVQLFRIILPTGFLMIHGLLLLFSAFLLHALITLHSEHSTTPPSKSTP